MKFNAYILQFGNEQQFWSLGAMTWTENPEYATIFSQLEYDSFDDEVEKMPVGSKWVKLEIEIA